MLFATVTQLMALSQIPARDAFKGSAMQYSVKSKNHKANPVSIDALTGLVTIKAEKRDHFDVKITAKNDCGKKIAWFNVIIDEEI